MFHSARIKLTIWYLLIIMIVSTFFSFIVYQGFTKELGRGFKIQAVQRIAPQPGPFLQDNNQYSRLLPFVIRSEDLPPEEYIEILTLAKRRFLLQLIIINGAIFFLAGVSGYFLAGKTFEPIEEMVDKQKRFIADASHELRTPLTSLKTEIEVGLRDKMLNLQEAKKLLKNNLGEIDNLNDFINHLLILSKQESNGHKQLRESVNLADAAHSAIEKNSGIAKEKGIKISKNIKNIKFTGNGQNITELISILINNAIKYSKENSTIILKIYGGSKRTPGNFNNKTIIEVTDYGVGIEKKDIPLIFDRFYRADTSRCKNEIDGFGLGLSIAKSIVESHNGEIKVKSALGKGSTFKVILPKS